MPSRFFIWRYRSVKGASIPNELRGVQKKFLLHKAVPLLATFPAEAAFHMNPDFPSDLVLPDNVRNGALAVLVSARVQQFLQAWPVPAVEYLPVKIIDPQGQVASHRHVIVNPVDPLDCIDRAQSVFTPGSLVPGSIERFEKLVIDPDRVPAERLLFRMRGFGEPIVVRRELAETMAEQGFSGLDWKDSAEFSGR